MAIDGERMDQHLEAKGDKVMAKEWTNLGTTGQLPVAQVPWRKHNTYMHIFAVVKSIPFKMNTGNTKNKSANGGQIWSLRFGCKCIEEAALGPFKLLRPAPSRASCGGCPSCGWLSLGSRKPFSVFSASDSCLFLVSSLRIQVWSSGLV